MPKKQIKCMVCQTVIVITVVGGKKQRREWKVCNFLKDTVSLRKTGETDLIGVRK